MCLIITLYVKTRKFVFKGEKGTALLLEGIFNWYLGYCRIFFSDSALPPSVLSENEMFGNIFKTESTKAKEELDNHLSNVMIFIEEYELNHAWERTRHIIFRNMDIETYIIKNGAYNRKKLLLQKY